MSSRRGSRRVYTDMYGECHWLSDAIREEPTTLRLERFRLNGCDAPYEYDANGVPSCMKCGKHNRDHPYADNRYCAGNAAWYYLEPPDTDEWLDLLTIMAK